MRIICIVIVFLSLFSCNKSNNQVTSKDIPKASQRVKTLQNYLLFKSPVDDCHFDIYDVNLSAGRSIPGPTDRTYKVALKVAPEHFEAWTEGLTHTSFPLNTTWYDSLIEKQKGFTYSTPTFMSKDGSKIVIGYQNEGLLFIRIHQR